MTHMVVHRVARRAWSVGNAIASRSRPRNSDPVHTSLEGGLEGAQGAVCARQAVKRRRTPETCALAIYQRYPRHQRMS